MRQDRHEYFKIYARKYRKLHPEYDRKHNIERRLRTISWFGRKIYLTFELKRPDCCDFCGKKGKKIDSHHLEYFIIFKWFGIVWLCVSCHMAEGYRLGQKKNI